MSVQKSKYKNSKWNDLVLHYMEDILYIAYFLQYANIMCFYDYNYGSIAAFGFIIKHFLEFLLYIFIL